ncbi:hypothetical protein SK128_006264 [Halocaridina rubra]|uniref:Uncharacterized protein n=1 Tax=Halocaridina rubra TaxID=373956 RepID=A0AAN8WXR7_HALRR
MSYNSAHQRFRNCVLETTPIECDAGGVPIGSGNSASQFMRDMLDRALGFLLQKCRESTYGPEECPNGNAELPVDNNLNAFAPSFGVQTTRSPPNDTRRTDGSSQLIDSITPNSIIPSLNLAGNNLLGGAERQQFRNDAAALIGAPVVCSLAVILFVAV